MFKIYITNGKYKGETLTVYNVDHCKREFLVYTCFGGNSHWDFIPFGDCSPINE